MVSTAHRIIRNEWLKISASATHGYVWLCDETIGRAIRACYPDIIKTINFNRKNVNSALRGLAVAFSQLKHYWLLSHNV